MPACRAGMANGISRAAIASLIIGLLLTATWPGAARAQAIAFSGSLSGYGRIYGQPTLDGARLAAEEAGERLDVHDDKSTEDGAREVARQIVASNALMVVGPILTPTSLAAGPIYADGGMASIVTTATGAGGPRSSTTFRTMATTPELGAFLMDYLHGALDRSSAIVLARDAAFGQQFVQGAKSSAQRLGLDVSYHLFKTAEEAQQLALAAAADHTRAVILGTLADDSVAILRTLRRHGITTPILGTTVMAGDAFSALFEKEHEGAAFFMDGVYAESPIMLDSANAETVEFADRFEARYHREATWLDVLGFDATNLAIAALHASGGHSREAVLAWLRGLNGPQHALKSLAGPLWFGRPESIRMGRFHRTLFESAPVQLVPVSNPDQAEIASGRLVDLGANRYAHKQQVVYTGVFLNELPRMDIPASTFTADLYLWLRFAHGDSDPGDVDFPDMVRGSFDPARPATERAMDDGTTYRLWRIRGDFKTHFDLHRYPADAQTLTVSLFNARAALGRLVYVQDRRSPGGIAPDALRDLTQWRLVRVDERRDVQTTQSAVGDPTLEGIERVRELSGYRVEVTVARRTAATLVKSLLPLGILTLIMFASLYFSDEGAKIGVAITGSLSSMVLLNSINTQFGPVGYTLAIEYVFYQFLGLCLLCIVSVLARERLCKAELRRAAAITQQGIRILFVAVVGGTALVAALVL